jgi:hypothetical protein
MLDLFGNEIPESPTPEQASGYKGAGANGAHSSGSESAANQRTAVAKAPRESAAKQPRTPLDEIEKSIIRKMQASVTFVPGSSHKRFVRDLNPDTSALSTNGRNYLAYLANRYRRQWIASAEEFAWVVQWCRYGALPKPRVE